MDRIFKKSGFTLAELLIVVAIIGVLVAVSVPIFTNQLKKARLATNQANARAAYAAAMAWYMDNYNTDDYNARGVGTYDVITGKFVAGYDNIPQPPASALEINDLNIANWTVDTPNTGTGKSTNKCLGDRVFSKWDVNWKDFDNGIIDCYTPYDATWSGV